MSKFKKPKSELTQLESRLLFKSLSLTIFKDLSCDELNKLSDTGISLKFSQGTPIAKRNELVVWFGILLQGDLLLSMGSDSFGTLQTGSFIGCLQVLDYKLGSTHIFDITGNSEGVISCYLLEDLSNIHRKMPKIAMKFIELIGKQSLNSSSYNLHQGFLFSKNFLSFQEYSVRRKQEFIMQHSALVNSELDRIDLKVLASVFKVVHFNQDSWITRKDTIENSVFFVVEGRCGNYELKEYEENVFGAEHFLLPNIVWENSVVGTGPGTLLWMKLEDFSDIVQKNPVSCGRFVKVLTNLVSCKIFDRKTQTFPLSVKTEQPFIELDPSQLTEKQKLPKITEESDEEVEKAFPLYTFPMFEAENEDLEKSFEKPESPELIFPKERLHKQVIDQQAKRKGKRSPSPRVRREVKKKEISVEINEIIMEIVVDIKQTEEMNQKLLEEIRKMKEENKELEEIINLEELEVESKEVRLKKNRVLKDIEKISHGKDFNLNLAKSFQHIMNDQVKLSKAFYLAWKYSEKWKEFVRKRQQQRSLKLISN